MKGKYFKVSMAGALVGALGLFIAAWDLRGYYLAALGFLVLSAARVKEEGKIAWDWAAAMLLFPVGFVLAAMGMPAQVTISFFAAAVVVLLLGGLRWNGKDIVALLRERRGG